MPLLGTILLNHNLSKRLKVIEFLIILAVEPSHEKSLDTPKSHRIGGVGGTDTPTQKGDTPRWH